MNLLKSILRLAIGRREPRTEGAIRVEGLDAPIDIGRDRFGVAYIDAKTDHDAWFALGFVHAQDRGMQLDVQARAVRGRLSEVLGADGIGIDRLSRRIGFRRAGEAQVAVADPEIRAQMEAYAEGVAAGYRATPRPPEMVLTGGRPIDIDAADIQGFYALLCFALAANWDMELLRYEILQRDGNKALRMLDPSYRPDLPVTAPSGMPSGNAVDRLAHDLELFEHGLGLGGGSNAWVLGQDRTSTGRPIIANDPHLNPGIPCAWYLVNIRTPQWAVSGATMVGIPAMGCGHNGFCGWAVTAAHADNTDLFLERVGPDGRSVMQGDEFVPCETILETIHVKGGDDIVEEVLITPRGPIISPALEQETASLSLSATWLHPRPYKGFLGLHKVRSFDEFRACFNQSSTGTASVLYADETGNIGWVLGVDIPERTSGFGNLPQPGWVEGAGWTDALFVTSESLHLLNPEAGFIATANNQPVVEGHDTPFLGVDWLDGYRQKSIADALVERDDWSVGRTFALQRDTRSIPWEEVRDRILELDVSGRPASRALSLLRPWDGHMSRDSAAASVFAYFTSYLAQRLVEEHAPNSYAWAMGRGFTKLLPYNLILTRRLTHLVHLIREQPEDAFADPWRDVLLGTFDRVIEDLSARFGPSAGDWAWGDVRPLTLEHLFGEKAPLDRIFNVGPIPYEGDASTIPQAAVDMADPSKNPIGVATLRMVIDVGEWDNSRWVTIHGQSGNLFSKHYTDQLPYYLRGEGIPVPFSRRAVEGRIEKRLRLKPTS